MKNNTIRAVIKIVLIGMDFFSLGFQLFYFIFSSFNRTSNDLRSRIIVSLRAVAN